MRESKTLEFKEALSSTFLKTVSAFANYGSGRVLFGITDRGEIVGVPDPESAHLSIENKINDSLSPVPRYSLATDPRTQVITLSVEEGLHKPYLYRAKAYRRSDTATVEVDRTELTRLILEGQNLAFDQTPSRASHLSFDYLGRRMKEVLGVESLTHDTLKSLELEGPDGTYNVAGELLADQNSFSGIDIVRFGDSVNVLLDRETYDSLCILEQYDRALALFRRYYRYEQIEGAERVARELVPEEAFREALANALVHRQWDEDARIRVSLFADRVEVVSPGGLPSGLSESEYLDGQISKLRNPVLGGVFFRLRIIERFGTGVLRIKDAYCAGGRQPAFAVYDNSVKVILPVLEDDVALEGDELAVYRALKGRVMPISEIVAACGFGKTKAQQILRRLVGQGLVSVSGVGRGTRYSAV